MIKVFAVAEPTTTPTVAIAAQAAADLPTCELAELLEDVPLHSPRRVVTLFAQPEHGNLSLPMEIRVHCDHQKCEGVRRHSRHNDNKFRPYDSNFYCYVAYACSNCTSRVKVFGLRAQANEKSYSGTCTKIHEEPPFGSPIPKRLFQIIGEANRDYFLQARRAVARGLGIGAYSYYRRIVENTKFDLVTSVLEVAQATNAAEEQVKLLRQAKAETQFSKAIEMLRDVGATPAVLLIKGHNPLALLHDLLSDGIHKLSDGDCLQRSEEAEVVLCEIAERMQTAMTERKTVEAAITNIMKRKAANKGTPAS